MYKLCFYVPESHLEEVKHGGVCGRCRAHW